MELIGPFGFGCADSAPVTVPAVIGACFIHNYIVRYPFTYSNGNLRVDFVNRLRI